MHVGVCRIQLHLPGSQSLKDRRQVVRSVIARLKNRFNVSVAEIENEDLWQVATLGVTCAGDEPSLLEETMSKIVEFVSHSPHEAEVVDRQVEVMKVFG